MFVARVDEEGHVITGPRNFTTKQMKKGKVDSVYFSKPSYVTVDAPYEGGPLDRVPRTEVKDGYKKAGHDINFKPAKHVPDKPYKAPYEHMVDYVAVKKNHRDSDGLVILEPKNFYTTPAKRGHQYKGTSFTPQPSFMPDDFNYPRELARKEMTEKKKLE